jgi:hypothetical protein
LNDKTERTRFRETVSRDKRGLTVYAVLALIALAGWLMSL